MDHGHGDHRLLDERQWAVFLATYEDRQRLMVSNEELGERRLQVYLTVVGATGVALGLVADRFGEAATLRSVAVASALLAVIGFSLTMRIAKRDCDTGGIKEDLLRMRRFVAGAGPLSWVLPHMTEPHPRKRRRSWLPNRGGLVDLLGLLAAVFSGVASFAGSAAIDDGWPLWRPVVAGCAMAAITWTFIVGRVRAVYDEKGCLSSVRSPRPSDPETPNTPQTFRAGVGIVVRNHEGHVLVLRRTREQSWQFPQGGIDDGEAPAAAALRELQEETALRGADVRIVAELPTWLGYELRPEHRSPKTGRGQVQRWFLAQLEDPTTTPDPGNGPQPREFDDFAWVTFDEAVHRAVDFRRPAYEAVRAAFEIERASDGPDLGPG